MSRREQRYSEPNNLSPPSERRVTTPVSGRNVSLQTQSRRSSPPSRRSSPPPARSREASTTRSGRVESPEPVRTRVTPTSGGRVTPTVGSRETPRIGGRDISTTRGRETPSEVPSREPSRVRTVSPEPVRTRVTPTTVGREPVSTRVTPTSVGRGVVSTRETPTSVGRGVVSTRETPTVAGREVVSTRVVSTRVVSTRETPTIAGRETSVSRNPEPVRSRTEAASLPTTPVDRSRGRETLVRGETTSRETPTVRSRETIQPSTRETIQPSTRETIQPSTRETIQPSTRETVQPPIRSRESLPSPRRISPERGEVTARREPSRRGEISREASPPPIRGIREVSPPPTRARGEVTTPRSTVRGVSLSTRGEIITPRGISREISSPPIRARNLPTRESPRPSPASTSREEKVDDLFRLSNKKDLLSLMLKFIDTSSLVALSSTNWRYRRLIFTFPTNFNFTPMPVKTLEQFYQKYPDLNLTALSLEFKVDVPLPPRVYETVTKLTLTSPFNETMASSILIPNYAAFTKLQELKTNLIRTADLRGLIPLINLNKLTIVKSGKVDFKSIQQLPNLTSLSFEGCDFGNEIAQLQDMPKLQEIIIIECYSFTELPSFIGCSSLAKIKVKGGDTPPRVAPLNRLKALMDFSLTSSSTEDTEKEVLNISFLDGCSTLQRLAIGYPVNQPLDVLLTFPDLTELDINEWPSEQNEVGLLTQIPKLRKLKLGGGTEYFYLDEGEVFPVLEELEIFSATMDDFPLFQAEGKSTLKIMKMADCTVEHSLVSLANCSTLESLDLSYADNIIESEADLDFLLTFTNLKELSLNVGFLTRLTFLRNCLQLRKLVLGLTQLANLDDIKHLTKMEYLNLTENNGPTRIGYEDPKNKLVDISAVRAWPNLRVILIPGVLLNNSSPLGECLLLEKVDLSYCRGIDTISPLARCTRIKDFNMTMSKSIPNIEVAANWPELERFVAESCTFSDLTPLSRCVKLKELDISQCKNVGTLAPLASLVNLRRVNVAGLRIPVHFSILSKCYNLTKIFAVDLEYADFTGLDALDNLTNIDVDFTTTIVGLSAIKSRLGDKLRIIPKDWSRAEKSLLQSERPVAPETQRLVTSRGRGGPAIRIERKSSTPPEREVSVRGREVSSREVAGSREVNRGREVSSREVAQGREVQTREVGRGREVPTREVSTREVSGGREVSTREVGRGREVSTREVGRGREVSTRPRSPPRSRAPVYEEDEEEDEDDEGDEEEEEEEEEQEEEEEEEYSSDSDEEDKAPIPSRSGGAVQSQARS
jgi:hypothetical protein